MLIVLLSTLIVSCQHDLPDTGFDSNALDLESGSVITLKRGEAGGVVSLSVDASALLRTGVWIDLDGDGKRAEDGTENVTLFNAYQEYTLAKGVTQAKLHGDVSYLAAAGNGLTSVDVSGNRHLTTLNVPMNDLTTIDLSQNRMLQRLDLSDNRLSSLDLSANTELVSLWCYNNRLTELDVKVNTLLASLDCSGNQLTHLDVSSNTQLSALLVYNNRLTALDISQNTLLNRLWAFGNELPDNETENLIATLRSTSGGDLWLTEEPLGPSLQARAIEKGWTVAR